jgi:hypothetical protein
MKDNKSLVQEALIQMKQVEEAIAENAKGILQSTMKEEISQLVKESLTEQDEEDEIEIDADVDTDADNDEMEMDMDVDTDDVDMDMDMDMDSDESPIDLTDASDEEILKVFKAMGEDDGIIVKKDGDNVHLTDDNADVEYLIKLGESMEDGYDVMEDDSEEDSEYDFEGGISEDDTEIEEDDSDIDGIIADIFKESDMSDIDNPEEDVVYEITLDDEMSEEDGINVDDMFEDDEIYEDDDMVEDDYMYESKSVKKTIKPKGVGIGSGPKFSYKNKVSGGFKEDMKQGPKSVGTGKAKFEYKKGGNMEGKSKIVKAETKEGNYGMGKDNKSKTMPGKKGDTLKTKAFEKTETKEAARTYGMGSKEGRGLRKGITNNRNYVYGKGGVKTESTQEEVRMLREKNEEYRKALNVFREKLNEVAIFNSNLAYATRLFTEHSTTKKEKINILRRFDDVETLKESKNLYKSIKDELNKVDTKSINESVGTKINKTVTTGSSTTLIESKTYENPQFLRMKDLMGKLG